MKQNLIFNLDLIHFRNLPKIFFHKYILGYVLKIAIKLFKDKLLNGNQVRTAKQLSLEM